MKPTVLILCTGNSCRSHMAEGILRSLAGDLFEVHSAGSDPAGYVHPKAIECMKAIDIDISAHSSKHLDTFLSTNIHTVITVCDNANEACPVFPAQAEHYHWPFSDPAKASGDEASIQAAFIDARDRIYSTLNAFVCGYRSALKLKG